MPPRRRRIDGPQLDGRTGAIWQAWIKGATQDDIAAQHKISQQRVSQILKDVQAEIEPQTVEAFNARTLDLLTVLTAKHVAIVDAGPAPKVSAGGKVVLDPATGQPIPDWSQVMQAAANVVRFSERAAKILGSDAASKVEAAVTLPEDVEVAQRIREWRAAREAASQEASGG